MKLMYGFHAGKSGTQAKYVVAKLNLCPFMARGLRVAPLPFSLHIGCNIKIFFLGWRWAWTTDLALHASSFSN